MSGSNVAEALAADEANATEGKESLDGWLDGFSEEDLGAPLTGDEDTEETDSEVDDDADHGDVEEESETDDEAETDDESEGGDEEDTEGESEEDRRETRGERRKRILREKVEEEIRTERDAEWQKAMTPVAEKHKREMDQATEQILKLDEEAEQQQQVLRLASAELDVYKEAIKQAGLEPHLADALEKARLKVELEFAKQQAGKPQRKKEPEQQQKPDQQAQLQIENLKLETMAEVAEIDVIDLKAELAKRYKAGKPYDPKAALKALVAKKQPAKPAKKQPKVLSGGESGGARAPALDLDLLTASDDDIAEAAEEIERLRRQQAKG